MLLIEALFKFGAIGALLSLGLVILRDGRNIKVLRYALLLITSMIIMFLTTGSDELRISGDAAVALRVFDTFNALFIWLLGLALFDDEFEIGKREWVVIGLFLLTVLPNRLVYLDLDLFAVSKLWLGSNGYVSDSVILGLMVHIAFRALVGRNEDLVEQRRRMRFHFATAIASVVILSLLFERLDTHINGSLNYSMMTTQAFTAIITIAAILWLTKLSPEALAFQNTLSKPELEKNKIEARDAIAYKTLRDLMQGQRIFATHGLTIGDLASTVGIPAHQLRSLINRSMGFQNFSAYLNHYRIDDIKQALKDPNNARTPILTLALDAGFSSLAPFNRAFKSTEGITPTEFRNNFLDNMSDNPDRN